MKAFHFYCVQKEMKANTEIYGVKVQMRYKSVRKIQQLLKKITI